MTQAIGPETALMHITIQNVAFTISPLPYFFFLPFLK